METMTSWPAGDPYLLLSNARELAHRVRREQRATWFPLLLLAALTLASVPVVRYGGHHLDCRAVAGAMSCRVYSDAEFVYWPVALVLAYVAIAAFYLRRSRARGLGTRVRPYAIAGIVIAVALTGAALLELSDPAAGQNLLGLHAAGLPGRLATPEAAIGLALLVLARAERNRPLLLLTIGYLAAILVPVTFAGIPDGIRSAAWYALPAVVPGTMLLLGGVGFALAQRPLRPVAS
jgi:hypothetical protein